MLHGHYTAMQVTLAFFVVGTATCCAASDEPSAALARVLTALKQRQAMIRTIQMRCVATAEYKKGVFNEEIDRQFPGQRAGADFPAADYAFDVEREYLIDFERGRFRTSLSEQSLTYGQQFSSVCFMHRRQRFLFDGTDGVLVHRGEDNQPIGRTEDRIAVDVQYYPAAQNRSLFHFEFLALLSARRLVVRSTGLTAGRVGQLDELPALAVDSQTDCEGDGCIVAVTQPSRPLHEEITFAAAGRILRWRMMSGTQPTKEIQLDYDEHKPHARAIGYRSQSWDSGQLFRTEVGTIETAFNVAVEPADFQYRPEARELSLTHNGESETYEFRGRSLLEGQPLVSQDGDELVKLELARRRRTRAGILILGLLLLLAAGMTLWLLPRRRSFARERSQ